MSLLGKILAVLNLVALGAFFYFMAADFQKRQEWSYAVVRWDIALDGLPVDERDPDSRGKPRYLVVNDVLAKELVDDETVRTQEAYADKRKEELLKRVDDKSIPGSAAEKLTDILVALATSPGEREKLLAGKADKTDKHEQELRSQLDKHFEALKVVAHPDPAGSADEKLARDRDAKRLAIARTLVATLEVLPTPDEKKKRDEDDKKPVDQRADPLSDKTYRNTLNAVGSRMMARALDQHGQELLTMAINVGELRVQERTSFVYQHTSLVNQLMHREHQLQEQRDKLAVVKNQADEQTRRADQQEAEVAKQKAEWEARQEKTIKLLEQLEREQEKLYKVRIRLRDANGINQRMEREIRRLEAEVEAENP